MLRNLLFGLMLLTQIIIVSDHAYGAEKSSRERLSEAINKGDLGEVKFLIESLSVEVDAPDYRGESPLLEAAKKADVAIMKYLVECGANIEGVSKRQHTVLTDFIEGGGISLSSHDLLEIGKFLIEKGADVNRPGKDGLTPLMNACKYINCTELVKLLIESGAEIEGETKKQFLPLFHAISYSNEKAFRLLLDLGADCYIIDGGLSALGIAALTGSIPMAALLIDEYHFDVNKYESLGMTPLMLAAKNGHESMIAYLIKRGANVNAKTRTLIELLKPPPQMDYLPLLSFSKTYFQFPRNSTALTFAKAYKQARTVNFLCNLEGIELDNFILKEKEYFSW